MSKLSIRTRLLRRNLVELQDRYKAAKERGENEVYLALCRFKIDELEAALKREERRAA